ncbi:MAG: TonB-dependent receptor [Prevotellaceae bacterium]|nr:TonB-dependent receptor [Prevotellaceae bacterium]
MLLMALLISSLTFAQTKVTGKVTDEAGETLIGASVSVKGGAGAGAITDLDGRFSLTVPAGKNQIVISYIGYVSETVTITGKNVVNVVLREDKASLEEVVVVGYGTMKKSDLSGATATMGEDKIKGSIITNIDQSFQGRVAGVTSVATSGAPGSSTSIRVRGQATINAGAEPLYVIDGVIFQGGGSSGSSLGLGDALGNGSVSTVSPMSTLNPSDIVSMEILKDASATAIYGAQGANGVVLITTKRGKTGEAKFTYDGMAAWQYQGKRIDILNLREFAEYYNDFVSSGWISSTDARTDFSDPSILGVGTNWQDAVFRTAFQQQHQIAAQGGTDKVKYYISGGFMDQEGTIIGSKFNRFNIRVNLDAQLKSWFKVGINTMYTNTKERLLKADGTDGVITYALTTPPDISIYDVDGNYTSVVREGWTSPNPVAQALSKDITMKRNKLSGNIFAEITPIKNLVWHAELGYDLSWSDAEVFEPTLTLGNWSVAVNSSRWQKNNSKYWQLKNYLTYNGNIEKHSFTAMLGQECWKSDWDYTSVYNTNLPNNTIHNPSLGANTPQIGSGFGTTTMASFFTRETYNFDDRYLATYTFRRDGSSNFGPDNRWASFHSFAVSWRFTNEKFMKFSEGWLSNGKLRVGWGQTGNANIGAYKWGSTVTKLYVGQNSVGYRPTNIPNPGIKWETQEQVNIGIDLGFFNDKLNITLDWYDKRSNDMLMALQLPSYMGTQGNASSKLSAPYGNYGKISNRGFELTVSAHPFSKKDFSWDSEFNISWNRNKLEGLSGTTNVNIIGYGQWNDVVCVSNIGKPLYQFWGYVTDGVYKDYADIEASAKPSSYKSGAYSRTTTVWPGDIKYKDLSGPDGVPDGVIDDYDKTYIGNPQPKYTFGWTNTFRYKDFDLTLFVSGSVGNKVLNYLEISMSRMNNAWVNQSASVIGRAQLVPIDPNKDYSNGYKGNNANTVWNWYDDIDNVMVLNATTSIPRAAIGDPNGNSTVISDRYVEDGSYLRMKNITLGYTLPKKFTRCLHIENLRVYANIQNLFTITGYSGYDPEVGASTSDSTGYVFGVDNGRYPSPTVYSFGLNLTF